MSISTSPVAKRPDASPATAVDPDVAVLPMPAAKPGKRRLELPVGATRSRILWPYFLSFIALHAMLPLMAVPWLFSWTGLALVPIGKWFFGSIGIGICYHRTLTHQGLTLPKWLEHFFALLGVCNLMESPVRWVAIHRMHHSHSDEREDPHSPLAGLFWGHFEWLIRPNTATSTAELYDRYARDILRDPFYLNLERGSLWIWIYVLHAVPFFLAGLAGGYLWSGTLMAGVQFGTSLVLWGVIYRTIYTWHITWSVNSLAHVFGYRNYETSDDSRNNWFVALMSDGEGWHNNHHADQVACSHGHRWWEFDVNFLFIRLLCAVGLAKNIKLPRGAEKTRAAA